jgi:hypothetical protein
MLVLAVLGLLIGVRIDTGTAGASTDLFFSDRAGVVFPKNLVGFMMILTMVMVVSRWPQWLRPTAFCFLAKAAQNGLDILDRLAGVLILGLAWLGLVPLPDGVLGISAADGLFLAMAHARLGHIDQAREWYRKSDEWMHDGRLLNSEVKRFREEAVAVLEVAADFAAKARAKEGEPAIQTPRPSAVPK